METFGATETCSERNLVALRVPMVESRGSSTQKLFVLGLN